MGLGARRLIGLSPRGNPTAVNMFTVIASLQRQEGFRLGVKNEADCHKRTVRGYRWKNSFAKGEFTQKIGELLGGNNAPRYAHAHGVSERTKMEVVLVLSLFSTTFGSNVIRLRECSS